ncbi:MAG: hypothetical protein KZQ83_17775 [gamma proteobacterium symbiont of Taylorina sp.]|nr:hypothetical protein [gamma proteobacterium symbiont of Taylorina sp.]
MKQRKNRTDSTSEMVKSKSNTVVAVPQGIDLTTEEERILWRQFTSARSNWRDFDLLQIGKMVKIEIEIRQIQSIIAEQGFIVENAKGVNVQNPLIAVEDTKQRMQLAIIGKLSLGVSAKNAIALNNSGKKAESEIFNNLKKKDVASLLAH